MAGCSHLVVGARRAGAGVHAGTMAPDTLACVVDALYAALDSFQQCRHILGSRSTPGFPKLQPRVAFHAAFSSLGADADTELTAKLNAAACLARMCVAQFEVADLQRKQVAKSAAPWYRQAKLKGTFKAVIASFISAFAVQSADPTNQRNSLHTSFAHMADVCVYNSLLS